jgi:hypothetical protein
MEFLLNKDDLFLIKAAISFGDRLKILPEITSVDIENINNLQAILLQLPKYTPNIDAEYGFGVTSYEMDYEGINRGWYVSLDTKRHNLIEIFSIYVIRPDDARDEDLERSSEYNFMFSLDNESFSSLKSYEGWIEEVRDPNRWRNPKQEFEIETDYKIS